MMGGYNMRKGSLPYTEMPSQSVIQLSFWSVGVRAIPQPLAIVLTNQMSKPLGIKAPRINKRTFAHTGFVEHPQISVPRFRKTP